MNTKPLLTLPVTVTRRIKLDEPTADTLALILWYLTQRAAGRIDADETALVSLLDSPGVADWLDRMDKAGRIKNTCFLQRSPSSASGTQRRVAPQRPFNSHPFRNHSVTPRKR